MPDFPNPISPEEQAKYEKWAERYYQEVIKAPELKQLEYFAGIQKQLEHSIRRRFSKAGYKLVRVKPAPGMYYKVVSKRDAFGFNVLDQHLILSSMMADACFVAVPQSFALPPGIPPLPPGAKVAFVDVKMMEPEYRSKKISLIANLAFEKFKPMKKLI